MSKNKNKMENAKVVEKDNISVTEEKSKTIRLYNPAVTKFDTTKFSGVNIREKPDLNSKVLFVLKNTEPIDIGELNGNEWVNVVYNNVPGYIKSEYVMPQTIID